MKKKGVLTVNSPAYNIEEFNESLKIFYFYWGHQTNNSENDNHGYQFSGGGSVINSLPAQYPENVTIDALAGDGTVSFRYKENSIILKPDEQWQNISHHSYTCGGCFPPAGSQFNETQVCSEEWIITSRFYNAGVFDKKTIVLQGQNRVPDSVLVIASGTVKPWNASMSYELIMGADQFHGFLTRWNEQMSWAFTQEQLSRHYETLNKGFLKKYTPPGKKSIYVSNITVFCQDLADNLGLTPEQSDQFAQAAEDYYDRGKMAVHGDYYTIGH